MTQWQQGEKVGQYEIITQLGQGGMATVYKAYHAQLDRYVAIKVMHQMLLEDESFLARFKREAQIVAKLTHPHIVPVYDFNEYKKQPYLVMKYLEGITLKQRLNRGALDLDEILYIMQAVGGALTYAHKQGVLHRDVKPSNIVIESETNTPYLTDFGLARIAASGESTMSADVVLGTPHYMSPEQASGKKSIDGRTDIYSLGIVLYELLVGRVPFTADTPYAVIHDHIYTPLPEPSRINPEIPLSVESVLLKSTAKVPDERYETADDMLKELRDAVEETNLKSLNPDRISIASSSLAKLREEISDSIQTPYMPSLSASRTPALNVLSGGSKVKTATLVTTPPRHDRWWMIGGCGTFFVISFIALAVLLSASNNLIELIELMQRIAPGNASTGTVNVMISNGADGGGVFIETINGIEVYNVPPLRDGDPALILANRPEDFMGYLISASVTWRGDAEKSHEFIAEGLEFAPDRVSYFLSAGKMADANEDVSAAVSYHLAALYEARDDTARFNQVRSIVGEYLYQAAEKLTGSTLSLTNASEGVLGSIYTPEALAEIEASIPVQFLRIRIQALHGNLLLAQRSLNNLEEDDYAYFAAEIALLRGEVLQKRRRTAEALTLWRSLTTTQDIPEWIQTQAQTYIKEYEE